MFTKLVVEGYRAFDHFEMENLCPVNLIVGMNNRGKTSLLEALELVGSFGDSSVIFASMNRRGELVEVRQEGRSTYYPDLGKIFHGFHWVGSKPIEITAYHGTNLSFFSARIETMERNPIDRIRSKTKPTTISTENKVGLRLGWVTYKFNQERNEPELSQKIDKIFEIKGDGGLVPGSRYTIHQPNSPNVISLSTEGWSREKILNYLERTLLTDDEAFIVDCLRILDPSIDRYAITSLNSSYADEYYSESDQMPKNRGVILKLKGSDSRIPIGSLGDGIWRILGIIAGLLNAKGGLFLVDEIDTGLHYSTISKMWEVVTAFAIKHNIQVFATTHSQDCIDSLASVIQSREFPDNSFSIQRINREQSKTVSYTEEEIVSCAEHGIEMR